ncbi:DUF4376 domain-containing protein [Pseudomonas putida]|uniref:DUF4376 domain-containing protein n=1 Tax=Pseudomonas putida TaxID=303 RepID=UPI003D99E5F1
MDIRNPRYNQRGTIDCEVEHGDLGWIPFTASPEDDNEFGRELYASLISGAHGAISPYAEMPLTAEQQVARIAERRYEVETSGITVDGMAINTDDRAKTLINGSAIKAMRNPAYTLRWKTPEGFVDLPSAQVLVMADAVADFVQACFDREADLLVAVGDGTFTTAMLNEGWPV